MRRYRQQIPDCEAKKILDASSSGVLSLSDSENRPYGVPMSFVFDGKDKIYFHCATEGKKLECIARNPQACFTVIFADEIRPLEFTTYYSSVVASGKIYVVDDLSEKVESLKMLSRKYSPGIDCEPEISRGIGRVAVLKFEIETLTGKEAIELTRLRQ